MHLNVDLDSLCVASSQVQDEVGDPSCSVAPVRAEDRLVGVSSLCGHVAHQVEVGIDEGDPFVEAVLVDQRGKAYQGLRSVVEAWFVST